MNVAQICYGSADLAWGGSTKGNSAIHRTAVFIVTVMTAEDIRQISSPLTSKHGDKCQESQQGLRVNNNKHGDKCQESQQGLRVNNNKRKSKLNTRRKLKNRRCRFFRHHARSFLQFRPFSLGVTKRRGFSAHCTVRDIANLRMFEECFVLRCHAVMNG